MKKVSILAGISLAVTMLTGCHSLPPGAEPGPHGTMAYEVLIEASQPGARIEANGEYIGDAPLRLKIYGDTDGTFHDFGAYHYVIRALPLTTNQFVQMRFYRTGRGFTPEDMIPKQVFFDMNQRTPAYAPPEGPGSPVYVYPTPPPPAYYWPYYGPSFRFYYGHGYHHRHW